MKNPGRGLNRYDIWQLGYSPININELYIALEKYPIQDIAKLLKDGFTSGFNMNCPFPRLPLDTKNLKCVLLYHVAAYKRVEHEITLDRIAGPFRFVQFQILEVPTLD